MEVKQSDSLEFLKLKADYENDIIFADPPYALGSEVIIRADGKVDYAKANDFMNKWEMPTGDFWEKWFIEAYRTLKHGGFLIMYGMDRQTLLFKYYASLSGFQEQQSIYWYFISNFPKATDLSKKVDAYEKYGKANTITQRKSEMEKDGETIIINQKVNGIMSDNNRTIEVKVETEPSTDLAKKYEGYKYSISPLKQTCETIMVFHKPNKTGSVLHDTLAMENGDDTITCSALDIDDNRVATNDKWEVKEKKHTNAHDGYQRKNKSMFTDKEPSAMHENGRYPAQTFIDSQVAEKLDLQSGVSKGNGKINYASNTNRKGLTKDNPVFNTQNSGIDTTKSIGVDNYADTGGCSKILHKCDYEQIDFDLFIYEPKVDSGERNNGLDEFEPKLSASSEFRPNHLEKTLKGENGTPYGRWKKLENNHPTLKPIDLNAKILKLFKTPNEQRICYPFAGSGSEIIGGLKADFQNWTACEINQEYVDIANARIKHYKENEYVQLDLFGGE